MLLCELRGQPWERLTSFFHNLGFFFLFFFFLTDFHLEKTIDILFKMADFGRYWSSNGTQWRWWWWRWRKYINTFSARLRFNSHWARNNKFPQINTWEIVAIMNLKEFRKINTCFRIYLFWTSAWHDIGKERDRVRTRKNGGASWQKSRTFGFKLAQSYGPGDCPFRFHNAQLRFFVL